ncbi:MAG: hypothetical protein JWQ42_930 [Edaphobacter sp.]|nr:hypothetical protein [Edaphobacter sp.]
MSSLPAHYSNETQLIEASWNRPLSAPLITQKNAVIGPLLDPKQDLRKMSSPKSGCPLRQPSEIRFQNAVRTSEMHWRISANRAPER